MAKISLNGFAMNVDTHAGLVPTDTLFLHGNLASNRWWNPALKIWRKGAQSGHHGRLIFGEWRGCGKSAPPLHASELDPRVLADDYILLLKELGVKKAHIVGHSTGGLIGLIAMMKAPELFERAVFLDPVSAKGVHFEQAHYDAFTQMSRSRDVCAVVMNTTIHGNDPADPFFQELVDDTFGVAEEIWHGVPDALKKVDVTADLHKVPHRVLVLHGEHDAVLPKEDSIALAKGLPQGNFRLLKDQGHSANVENPGLFVEMVNGFLYS